MANREACELYIEQEIKSGLEEGKKPYSIGKKLSVWIEKLFEVNINPHTIEMRAHRQKDDVLTNVSNDSTLGNHSENENNQSPLSEIKAPRSHRTTGEPKGGKRKGAGRPTTKSKLPPTPKEQIFEDRFKKAFDQFYYEVQNAKMEKWEKTTKEAALYHIDLLINLITIS